MSPVALIAICESPDFWFRLISRIERHMSLDEMGGKVGSSAPSLCRYKAGRGEPRWSVARKLIALDQKLAIYSTPEMQPVAQSGG